MIGLFAISVLAAAQDVRREERVEVERVLVEVRVLASGGAPLLGLGATDFEVRVDGEKVPVESALWTAARPAPAAEAGVDEPPAMAGGGRLVVFFVQKDLDRSRAPGLLRMLRHAEELLDRLPATDRVAVASFDSHLKLWTDATGDRERPRRALRHSVLFEEEPLLHRSPGAAEGTLAAAFDFEGARAAATTEQALRVLGEALEALPGPKTIVFLGWGLGQLTPVGVRMGEGYEDAARALLSADAAVFTLDVTEADSHTLEVGLQELAERTGGFYARTHVSAPGAMNRLRGALAGHYLLSFERPAAKPGAGGRLEVRLRGARGEVLAPAQIPMPAP